MERTLPKGQPMACLAQQACVTAGSLDFLSLWDHSENHMSMLSSDMPPGQPWVSDGSLFLSCSRTVRHARAGTHRQSTFSFPLRASPWTSGGMGGGGAGALAGVHVQWQELSLQSHHPKQLSSSRAEAPDQPWQGVRLSRNTHPHALPLGFWVQ